MALPAATLDLLLEEVRALRREVADLRRHGRRSSARLLSFRQAAAQLGIDRARIPGLVSDGRVKTVPGPNGEPRIPALEVDRLEAEGIPAAKARRRRARPHAANDVDAIGALNVRDL